MIERDLRCPRGDSFDFTFVIRDAVAGEPGGPRDLSEFTAACQVKSSLTNGVLLATMEFNSSEEDLSEGLISLHLPASITQDIPIGTYFYDVVLTDNVNIKTYFAGKFIILNKVTEDV